MSYTPTYRGGQERTTCARGIRMRWEPADDGKASGVRGYGRRGEEHVDGRGGTYTGDP